MSGHSLPLTRAESELLDRVRTLDGHGMALVTGRKHRRRTAERLRGRGLLATADCVASDGDGYTIEPERWVTGYVLTHKGYAQFDGEKTDVQS